jgi:hypothetical protein
MQMLKNTSSIAGNVNWLEIKHTTTVWEETRMQCIIACAVWPAVIKLQQPTYLKLTKIVIWLVHDEKWFKHHNDAYKLDVIMLDMRFSQQCW